MEELESQSKLSIAQSTNNSIQIKNQDDQNHLVLENAIEPPLKKQKIESNSKLIEKNIDVSKTNQNVANIPRNNDVQFSTNNNVKDESQKLKTATSTPSLTSISTNVNNNKTQNGKQMNKPIIMLNPLLKKFGTGTNAPKSQTPSTKQSTSTIPKNKPVNSNLNDSKTKKEEDEEADILISSDIEMDDSIKNDLIKDDLMEENLIEKPTTFKCLEKRIKHSNTWKQYNVPTTTTQTTQTQNNNNSMNVVSRYHNPDEVWKFIRDISESPNLRHEGPIGSKFKEILSGILALEEPIDSFDTSEAHTEFPTIQPLDLNTDLDDFQKFNSSLNNNNNHNNNNNNHNNIIASAASLREINHSSSERKKQKVESWIEPEVIFNDTHVEELRRIDLLQGLKEIIFDICVYIHLFCFFS